MCRSDILLRPRLTDQISRLLDEVSAIVLDPGYSTTRAGFAGEDAPKSVVPTFYGVTSSGKLLFGDNALHDPQPNVEVRNALTGGGAEEWVADWDVASKLWEYSITSRLTGPRRGGSSLRNGASVADGEDVQMGEADEDSEDGVGNQFAEHPLLMSESGKASTKSREKVMEIVMEGWEVPAFYLTKTGVLAA
jgi:actin-related protein 4